MQHLFWNVIFPLYILITLGFLAGKIRKNPDTEVITFIVLYFLAPALVFSSFRTINISFENIKYIIINGVITIGGVWFLAYLFSRFFHKIRSPAFEISSAIMNIGYLGIPLVYVLLGEKAVGYAVTYMVFVTIIHFTVVIVILNPGNLSEGLKEIFKIPLIYAVIFSLFMKNFPLPSGIEKMIKLMGDSTMPLMLITIGIKLSSMDFKDIKFGISGTVLRLICGTFISFFVIKNFPVSLLLKKTIFIQSALPSAILNFVLCDKFKQQPNISASIIFFSTVVSPVWLLFVIKLLFPLL